MYLDLHSLLDRCTVSPFVEVYRNSDSWNTTQKKPLGIDGLLYFRSITNTTYFDAIGSNATIEYTLLQKWYT